MPKWHYDEPNIHDVKRGVAPQRERVEQGRKKQAEGDWLVVVIRGIGGKIVWTGEYWGNGRKRYTYEYASHKLAIWNAYRTEDQARMFVEREERIRMEHSGGHPSHFHSRFYYCHRSVFDAMRKHFN